MDTADARILDLLQTDATLKAADIASRLGMDVDDCTARINRLEDDGTIAARVALLDPRKAGVGVTVFVALTTPEHSPEWIEAFHAAIDGFPEVMDCYRMSGQVDYLLRVVVEDIDAYDAFYKKLIASAALKDVSSTFAMEAVKHTTKLPLRGG
jgi:Lrp/AsnC family transcriptional regulator